jgi:phospholipid/cholesterol/gamma-HCH transport system ATP-binding protein
MTTPTSAPPPVVPPPVVLSIEGLTKSFGDRVVLRGVNLQVRAAENVVVLGRSGSGKSVLIKIAVGLLRPDEGQVRIFGEDVHSLPPAGLDRLRRRVGFSFQSGALYDSMSVRQNLEFPLRMNIRDLSPADVRERVASALAAVGLERALEQMPSELSGGQRKRLGIARTLILRPEIMLYDEPTAGLDPITSGEINELIRSVQESYHTASIIITHDLTCARSTGDRVAMLHQGEILREGTFADVFQDPDPRLRSFYDYNFTQNNFTQNDVAPRDLPQNERQ